MQALLNRRSIRSFAGIRFDEQTMRSIQKIPETIKVLYSNNCMKYEWLDCREQTSANRWLGIFQLRIIPDYFLIPSIVGNQSMLLDFGFRVEQIVIGLWQMGIGSCFIGSIHQEGHIKRTFGFNDESRVPSILVFGKPAATKNEIVKTRPRKSFEKLILNYAQAKPMLKVPPYRELLSAARSAPSAINSQPWRFNIYEKKIEVFPYYKNPMQKLLHNSGYVMHDIGVCMANIEMAAEALRLRGEWIMGLNENLDSTNVNLNWSASFKFL